MLEDIELQALDEDEAREVSGSGRWFGRIRVVRICGKECFIGPHWPFTIALLCIMCVLTLVFVLVMQYVPWLHISVGSFMIVLSFASFFNLLASNPGILGKPSGKSAPPFDGVEQLFPSSGGRECDICNILQPNGALHCEYCQVCVEGYDHHCPWTSKCIGKDNMRDFVIFLGTGVCTLFYLVFVIALHGSSLGKIPR